MATVTWGATYNIPGGLSGRRGPVIKLSNHQVICFYVKAPQVGYGCIFDVDPATGVFTQYAESQFWNNLTAIEYTLWACLLNSSTLLVIYKNAGDGNKPYGKIGIITGTNIVWGAAQRIYNFDCDWLHCDTIDSTRAIMVMMRDDFPNEGTGEVCIIERTGNTISAVGGSQVFQANRWTSFNLEPWVTALNTSEFVISFIDKIGLANEHHVYYGTVVGNVTTLISFSSWDTETVGSPRGIRLTDSTYCVMWNNGTSTEGRIAAGTVPTAKGATVVLNVATIFDLSIGLLSDGRVITHYLIGTPQFRSGSVAGGVVTMDAAVAGAIDSIYGMVDVGMGDIVVFGEVVGAVLVYGTIVVIPTVTTDDAAITTHAVLNGTLDDDGNEACNCGFEWGTDPSILGTITGTTSRLIGKTFTQTVALAPDTYYYRAVATNSAGTVYGAVKKFVIPVTAYLLASVATLAASNIKENSAQLNGHVNESLYRYGEVRFEYGLTAKYGQQTGWQQGGFITGDSFSADLTNLREATAYHFRAQMRINPIISGADSGFSTLSSTGPITWVTPDLLQRVSEEM